MVLVKKIKKNNVMVKTALFELRSYLCIFHGVSTFAHFKNGISLEQRERYRFRIAVALFNTLFAS